MASSSALATNSKGLIRRPASSGRAASRVRSAIIRVTSTVRNSVTCGAVKALATIAAAVCLRTPLIGIRCSRPSVPVSATGKRTTVPASAASSDGVRAGAAIPVRAASTSARVMTPPAPVPVTVVRSTPRSLAYLRTGGLANGRGAPWPGATVRLGAASTSGRAAAAASAWRPISRPPCRTGLVVASGAVASSGGRSVPPEP